MDFTPKIRLSGFSKSTARTEICDWVIGGAIGPFLGKFVICLQIFSGLVTLFVRKELPLANGLNKLKAASVADVYDMYPCNRSISSI